MILMFELSRDLLASLTSLLQSFKCRFQVFNEKFRFKDGIMPPVVAHTEQKPCMSGTVVTTISFKSQGDDTQVLGPGLSVKI